MLSCSWGRNTLPHLGASCAEDENRNSHQFWNHKIIEYMEPFRIVESNSWLRTETPQNQNTFLCRVLKPALYLPSKDHQTDRGLLCKLFVIHCMMLVATYCFPTCVHKDCCLCRDVRFANEKEVILLQGITWSNYTDRY